MQKLKVYLETVNKHEDFWWYVGAAIGLTLGISLRVLWFALQVAFVFAMLLLCWKFSLWIGLV